ncbi:MAG TPA: Calx-beta domain-containing protein, partial [Methylomirabilota bacterium]|nr:Calx-beta domain-containing protein [Methylomirabilota bacterium]
MAVLFIFSAARTEALDNLAVTAPPNGTEGAGILVNQGRVILPGPLSSNLTVTLSSSDTTEVTVPVSVILLAGETNKAFDVTIVDDGLIDGAQTATVTAHAEGWNDGTASIAVLDNETLNLVVTLPSFAYENTGVVASAGNILLSGTLTTNVTISLMSSDTTEATVPVSLTLLAGRTNRVFNITMIDDALVDGAQTVTVTASAPGLVSGFAIITVLDNESPPMPFNPNPADLATNISITTDLSWANGQVGLNNDVYFGTNPAPAQLLGTTSGTAWNLPQLLPNTIYYWRIVARAGGTTPGPVWRFTTRSVDHFDFSSIASPQFLNQPFPVTITARDQVGSVVSNYIGTVALKGLAGGGLGTNTILGNLVHTTAGPGDWTLGYAFRPGTNLMVTHMRSYSGTKMSIWTDGGVLVVSQPVSGVAGVWTETPLASPVLLAAGTTYRVAYYTGGTNNFYFHTNAAPTSFPHGTVVHGYYYASGESFPNMFFNLDNVVFLCDLRYTVGTTVPVAITPTNTGNFSNGVWNGHITVLQPTADMHLAANDADGPTGESTSFTVLTANDLSVAIIAQPVSLLVGRFLTNTITVTNSGPAAATGVSVTNSLPPSVTFVSAVSSQGSCALVGSRVECALGNITGSTFATIHVVTIPSAPGQNTNRVAISRAEADGDNGNNSAQSIVTVLLPSLSVTDVSVPEGDGGLTPAVFSVQLSAPSPTNVTVNFTTVNGTATAGSDYTTTNGVLTFAPGQTSLNITVLVRGDTNAEASETFSVSLSNPVNATLNDSTGVGTITNDDGAPPEFQIAALLTSNSQVVDHNALTGDDRGGIAASSNTVLYSGDNSTARFALADLSGGTALGATYDALVSDLRTGTIYSLGNGFTPLNTAGGVATTLLPHDGTTGVLNGPRLFLTTPISMPAGNAVGIFAGYGQIMLHNGSRVYSIAVPSGVVTDLGAMAIPNHMFAESWAYWGVAEYVAGVHYLVYVRDPQTIVRTAVPSGATTTLASFSNLSDMAAFTVSVPLNRWYFHYEGSGQFGGSAETIGYADAIFNAPGNPPTIVVQPINRIAVVGGPVTFNVTAG